MLLGTDGADVRSAKICRSLTRLGHEVHFVGWDRRGTERETVADSVRYHLMDYEVRLGRSTLWAQAKFGFFAARMLRAIRPDAVYAVNEDNVLRAAFFRRLFYQHLVCDFYDSHADRFSESVWPIRWPMQAVNYLTKKTSDRLIVTDWLRWERLGRFKDKALIVQNVPEDPGDQLARGIPTGPTKILFTGAMGKNRGLRQLLQAIEECPEARIIAAGRPSDAFAEQVFLQHKQVEYRGSVSPRRSLEFAAECDAIFAFYAPISTNQVYASPNKLFDAMCVGRPVILNSEVKISRWAADKSVGLLCPYDDVNGLRGILKSLQSRRDSMAEFSREARQRYLASHSWEIMENVLGELCDSLDDSIVSE